jgi:hypothetical protein
MGRAVKIAVWNVEWARAGSPRGERVVERLAALGADVLCVAEGEAALLPAGGHVATSRADYGYPLVEGRRKTLLWSREPWRDVDDVGDARLPSGRYVAGTTDTPLGEVRVVGVCVPWRDAHVRTGRRDRAGWEDHLTYLKHLGPLLRHEAAAHERLVVMGDYNQRIPRKGAPVRVAQALDEAFAGLTVVTACAECEGRALVDHIAVGAGLRGIEVRTLPRRDGSGRLSDHDTVIADLGLTRTGA